MRWARSSAFPYRTSLVLRSAWTSLRAPKAGSGPPWSSGSSVVLCASLTRRLETRRMLGPRRPVRRVGVQSGSTGHTKTSRRPGFPSAVPKSADIPGDRAQRLHDLIPGSRVELIEDAGHHVQEDRPTQLNAVLHRWLIEQLGERIPQSDTAFGSSVASDLVGRERVMDAGSIPGD